MTARLRRECIARIRASTHEIERWTAAAEQAGHPTLSSWMRDLADQAAATGSNGREVAGILVSLRSDLARGVGNNINQLAKHVNEGHGLDGDRLEQAALDVHYATLAIGRALRTIKPPKARAT